MNSEFTKGKRNQRGIGLIIALMTLFILSVLAAGLILVTNSEIMTTANYRLGTQARYAAEYGAQQTAVWIANNNPGPTNTVGLTTTAYPVQLTANGNPVVLSAAYGVSSNYPDSTIQNAFHTAQYNQSLPSLNNYTYSTSATLLSMVPFGGSGTQYQQTWQIVSQANFSGVRNAQVQVTENIQRIVGDSLYQYAILGTGTGCGSVLLSGGSFTDSFDSSAGTYAATVQASGGNVGTNGNLSLSGGSTIVKGNLSSPNSGTGSCSAGSPKALSASGGASVSGTVSTLSSSLTVTTPAAPSPAPPTTNQSLSGNCGSPALSGCTNVAANKVAVVPGTYGNLTVSGGTQLHLSAGTYNLNSITLSGGSPIYIDSGPVIINVAGASKATPIDMSGGSVTNSSGVPMNCQINYAGTGTVKLSGGSASYAVVDTPNADIVFSGGSNWYGAVIASTVNDSGGTAVHYDRSLSTTVASGKFQVVGFNWNKF